jgi:hypothetical protein
MAASPRIVGDHVHPVTGFYSRPSRRDCSRPIISGNVIRAAAITGWGAICLRSSIRFAPRPFSCKIKPVAFPLDAAGPYGIGCLHEHYGNGAARFLRRCRCGLNEVRDRRGAVGEPPLEVRPLSRTASSTGNG